jgi:hypothetical protein
MAAKKVNFHVIPRDEPPGPEMYALLNRMIEEHHEHLMYARIALAWATAWKPDVDGRVTLGKCKRVGDPDRELMGLDFVIMLQADFWQSSEVSDAQRAALLDHELSHAEVVYDTDGEPAEDERGRRVYRLRKHDVEEFSSVIRRHGTYKRDLEDFAAALNHSQRHLFADIPGQTIAERALSSDAKVRASVERLRPKPGSGIDSIEIVSGGRGARLNADGTTQAIES